MQDVFMNANGESFIDVEFPPIDTSINKSIHPKQNHIFGQDQQDNQS